MRISVFIRFYLVNKSPFFHVFKNKLVNFRIFFVAEFSKTICINPGSEYLDDFLNIVIIDLDNLEDVEQDML